MLEDTIAAVSTPLGGGIGIIRISGERSFKVVEKIFRPVKPYQIEEIKTQTMKYGHIFNPQTGETIDEVLVSFFKKPHTYTRENMAEINCHGGPLIAKRILELVLENGARLAEPGEFTKRAFLNGRIDLSQAEAVIELINAKTDSARRISLRQLEGRFSEKIKKIRGIMVESIADIEVGIDYPEYDIEEVSMNKLYQRMEDCLKEIRELIGTFSEGRIIREGLEIAIVGKPNVGKSSLLNALVQKERAIVTEIPGTTRDMIEEYIELAGVPVKIIDTAGLRETEDLIEKMGIERTKMVINKADLILLVLDGSEEITSEDKEFFEYIKNKKVIIVVNKIDLDIKLKEEEIKNLFSQKELIWISAKEEIGLEEIENAIKRMFFSKEIELEDQVIVTNVRHKKILEETAKELENVLESINSKVPIDIISISITEAANKLGELTGEIVSEEVLNTIFSKFCIGK